MASQPISVPKGGNENDDDQADEAVRNPDTLPTTEDPSGTCARCGRTSNFERVGDLLPLVPNIATPKVARQHVAVLKCHGCGEGTAVIEEVRFSENFMFVDVVPLHWWPVPGSAVDMADVPSSIAKFYREAVRCVSVEAPHAAVAMCRNALALIVQDKGSDAAKRERSLSKSIKKMVEEKTLADWFAEWATHIIEVGNAGAHPEAFEEVTLEQAQDLKSLTHALIESLYLQPAKLQRMRPASRLPRS
ncbi:DUF4145 domain-containing protein [Nocardia tengchongensis]|uniref:DUF4145 domain-containing protein n=1 Tax=Nocardia tengchongensis TaxID=2055889 RepID=UPI00364DFB9C